MQTWRQSAPPKTSIGFVPTMGALHEGHLSLIRRARKENKITVVSIFVNPIQFGPREDLKRYPRPWKKDKELLKKEGVDILLNPEVKSMYSSEFSTSVAVDLLTDTLCGSPTSRGPRHFVGVATVVAKLFNIVRPTRAYVGLKDYQQVRVIEQMNEDLNFGIKIVRCPTVREADGLALSSRNAYLSPSERREAAKLYAALQEGRKLLRSVRNPHVIIHKVKSILLTIPQVAIDYVELVDSHTLQPVRPLKGSLLLAAAVKVGKTRLIDNILIQ